MPYARKPLCRIRSQITKNNSIKPQFTIFAAFRLRWKISNRYDDLAQVLWTGSRNCRGVRASGQLLSEQTDLKAGAPC